MLGLNCKLVMQFKNNIWNKAICILKTIKSGAYGVGSYTLTHYFFVVLATEKIWSDSTERDPIPPSYTSQQLD